MADRQRLGASGETAAAQYLRAQGLTVTDRNLRTPHGEIDIIARDGDMIVFVEVKSRRGVRYGYPEYAVTPTKRRHISAAAEWYLGERRLTEFWRIDIISVSYETDPPAIAWFKNI